MQVLINGGLQGDRVKVVGYWDSKPRTTNDTDKGLSRNRRLEIVITQTAESGIVVVKDGLRCAKSPSSGARTPLAGFFNVVN